MVASAGRRNSPRSFFRVCSLSAPVVRFRHLLSPVADCFFFCLCSVRAFFGPQGRFAKPHRLRISMHDVFSRCLFGACDKYASTAPLRRNYPVSCTLSKSVGGDQKQLFGDGYCQGYCLSRTCHMNSFLLRSQRLHLQDTQANGANT